MSINWWMDKEDVVRIWNGKLLSHKKEWNNAICSNMDATRGYIKWSKSERDKYHMCYHLYVESKIWHKWTYLQNRNKLTDKEQNCVCPGGGGEGGRDWEFGTSRYKLLHIGWINNKVLLYSTKNYIQYPMINHNGKVRKKECLYVFNTLL